MEMPIEKLHQEFNDDIKVIEANIKDIASGTAPQELYEYSQNKLDNLAERFQYNERLGTSRYKLYELQALLYFFENKDDEALAFIKQAIEIKGTSYKRAEKLIAQIESAPSAPSMQLQDSVSDEQYTSKEHSKSLVGISGWLAWFVFGLFISTGISVYNFFKDGVGLSASDIESLNQYKLGLGDTFHTLVVFENIAVVLYIILLVTAIILIFRRSKYAKMIAIAGLAFGAVYSMVDYAITASLLESSGLAQYAQTELSSASGNAGREIVVALVWIPYFIWSKRVRLTLTN